MMGEITKEQQRDLELIVFGAVLVKGEPRDSILAVLPRGIVIGEVGELVDAIRDQQSPPLTKWLDDHKCQWDKKRDCIQAIVDCVLELRQRQVMTEKLKGLAFLAATAPLAETKACAARLLQQISEMP